ncbi:MAG: PA0069 family radical SAM protein [Leptospirales bacterium]|nr:PA0069 family radical SAM protein [Leptospirales bacterium]
MERWRGRAAGRNPTGRFESIDRTPEESAATGERAPTEYRADQARSILVLNQSPDIPFEVSLNPYRGCEHGCVYCYARPYHAYLGLSSGLDFETRIFYKEDAAALLGKEFSRKGYQPRPIAIAGVTDPYQPAERNLRITRSILALCLEFRHPVTLITKSALILRDLDILSKLGHMGLVHCYVSLTSLDADLVRSMEPRASSPARRLQSIAALAAAAVPVGVMVAPVIPGLNDEELERILDAARRAGARSAGTILLRLPHELREIFDEWLVRNYPERRDRVWRLIESARDGNRTDSRWGLRMTGTGHFARLLNGRFMHCVRRLQFVPALPPLREDLFRKPGGDQPDLFQATGEERFAVQD